MRLYRAALFATFGALAALAAPAQARDAIAAPIEAAATELAANQFVWSDVDTGEAVSIIINIGEQRAYVYRGAQMVAAATVSTGKDGKDTPSGTFTILQKEPMHRSNLYDAAPMPFMQRLTWDGVAIHAGRNPGFPASHGCVRVPTEFAKKLFAVTTVGTQVTVVGIDGLVGPAYDASGTADETASANNAALTIAAR